MTFAARQLEGREGRPPGCVYTLTIQLPITIIAADDEAANYGLTCEAVNKYTQRGANEGISSIRMEVMCTKCACTVYTFGYLYYLYYLYLRPT